MAMESYVNGITGSFEKSAAPVQGIQPVKQAEPTQSVQKKELSKEKKEQADEQDIESIVALMNGGEKKEPAQSTIDTAMSSINTKMSMAKTRCAYAYDKDTRRITIKVYDDETDELIREVPPEKSLEALKRIWELAGIFVDEKR